MKLNIIMEEKIEKVNLMSKDMCYSTAMEIISVKPKKIDVINSFRSITNSYNNSKFLQIGSEVFIDKENDMLAYFYTNKSSISNRPAFSNCLGYITRDMYKEKIFTYICRAFIKNIEFNGDQIDVVIDVLFFHDLGYPSKIRKTKIYNDYRIRGEAI
ncbi:MAG: hypothetical protein FWE36_00095 [Erysipelotrichales bacterium]|nr:hypothetical protein [Erysipelotrichales bacterium]